MPSRIKNFLFCAVPALCLISIILPIVIGSSLEITPDSIVYLLGAQNLSKGHGFSNGCSQPVPNTTWAPGYSFLISFFSGFGLSLTNASILISILAYSFLLIGVYVIVLLSTGSGAIAVVSLIAVGLHPVILRWQGAMLSDSLAWSFLILIVLNLLFLIRKQNIKNAILLGIVVGFSMLVRFAYLGFAVGSLIVISFLILRAGWRRALALQTAYASVAFGILGLWLLRNFLIVGDYSSRGGGNRNIVWSFVLHFLNWWDVIAANISPDDESRWQALILLILIPLFLIGVRSARKFFYGIQPVEAPQILFLVSSTLAFAYTGILWILNCVTKSDIDSRMFSPVILLFLFMLVSMFHQHKNAKSWDVKNIVFAGWAVFIACSGLIALPEIAVRSKWYAEWKDNQTMNYVIHNYKSSDVMVSDFEPFWYWYHQCPDKIPKRKLRLERASELAKHTKVIVWLKRLPGYAPESHRLYLIQPSDIIWDINVEKTEFNDGVIYDLKPN